jgi:hypothetical protein
MIRNRFKMRMIFHIRISIILIHIIANSESAKSTYKKRSINQKEETEGTTSGDILIKWTNTG